MDDAASADSEMTTKLVEALSLSGKLPASVKWELAGDQEDQAESQAFLSQAFIGALGLMFVILLAQFNSLYNSVVVLLAVIMYHDHGGSRANDVRDFGRLFQWRIYGRCSNSALVEATWVCDMSVCVSAPKPRAGLIEA